MKLKSQEMRELAPELDPLRIGTGWKPEATEPGISARISATARARGPTASITAL